MFIPKGVGDFLRFSFKFARAIYERGLGGDRPLESRAFSSLEMNLDTLGPVLERKLSKLFDEMPAQVGSS